ncbi:MAG TPA: S8 family serine peptidase [Candidatus Kapabacteria bacterium]|nr:S8 family serine peptidase [Candidatus Kapabacteria bacterium]HPO62577.1 S8 family serine peptidase [Candidatus Kapabacteria bacterium]
MIKTFFKNTFIIIFIIIQFFCFQQVTGKQIIVKYKNSSLSHQIKSLKPNIYSQDFLFQNIISNLKKNDINQSFEIQNKLIDLSNYYILNISDKLDADSILNLLQNEESIESAELNQIFKVNQIDISNPNDEFFKEQWGIAAVNCKDAWKKASGKGILVGVIDTGIDYYHPDLVNQLWINNKEDLNKNGTFEPWHFTEIRKGISGDLNGIDDDENGFTDDVIGYDFVDQQNANIGDYLERDPIPYDEMGHGTLVSGVIAAQTNNKIGISGIAYNSKIVTLRAFDATGNAETDDIASAIIYAALNSIKVMNFSFGENLNSPLLYSAIKFANSLGCVMIGSKGNNGWALPHFPSDYPEVIAVGSSTPSNYRDIRSNYGSNLSLLAPGSNIFTTDVNSSYKFASGTSLASPFVSAAAAMLLELDSSLSPNDVKGILEVTAKDIYGTGWDEETGNGILDIGKAINNIVKTDISIFSPLNFSGFNKDSVNLFNVIGNVTVPLFESWKILLGKSANPKVWDTLTENNYQQTKNAVLTIINLENLLDTTYTLQLLVNLKNGKSIQKRLIFSVYSPNSDLEIKQISKNMIWKDGKLIPAISIYANYPITSNLFLVSNSDTTIYSINSHLSSTQTFLLKDGLSHFIGKAIIEAKRIDGKKIRKEIDLSFENQIAPTSSFNYLSTAFPSSFLLNQVSDIYTDKKPAIVVNDMPYNFWQSTKIYEYNEGNFDLKDSIDYSWIPVAVGKDNNGIPEILVKSSGKTVLFKPKSIGESPFSYISFQDTLNHNLWASGLLDINKDGQNEIIANSDSSFHIFSKINNEYKQIAFTPVDTNAVMIGTSPGFAFDDIDNDGIFELCHSNPNGNLFIYKFLNNNLILNYKDSLNYSNSSQNIVTSDIDNDGFKEVLILSYGSTSLYGIENEDNTVWSLRIYKKIEETYKIIHTEYFWDVKSGATSNGISFRNGIVAGDVDEDKVEEIIVSTFPNLYVFKWSNDIGKLNPIWYYPNAMSNSAVIYDFNQNGINELCFSSFNNTLIYEFDNNINSPSPPLNLDGWANNSSNIFLQWNTSNEAQYYEIFQVVESNGNYELIQRGRSDTTFFNYEAEVNKELMFVVTAYNENFSVPRSKYSNLAYIFTFPQIEPLNIIPVDNNSLLIEFSGKLPRKLIENSIFRFSINGEKITPYQVLFANDSSYLISFEHIIPKGEHKVDVLTFRDYYGNWSIEKMLNFIWDFPPNPKKEIYLSKINVISNYFLELEFSEDIESSTAINIENYTLKPNGKIEHISLIESNPKSVAIDLSQTEAIGALGKTYYLTAKDIISKEGIPITKGAGNTLSFIFSTNDLDNCFIYPNPIRYSEQNDIYFGNITKEAEIKIYDFEGKLLKKIYTKDQTGGVYWNGLDENNLELKPGIYIFNVTGFDKNNRKIESNLKKFAIIQ